VVASVVIVLGQRAATPVAQSTTEAHTATEEEEEERRREVEEGCVRCILLACTRTHLLVSSSLALVCLRWRVYQRSGHGKIVAEREDTGGWRERSLSTAVVVRSQNVLVAGLAGCDAISSP
jgi:hypothetical protein